MVRILLFPGLDSAPAPHWQCRSRPKDPTARIVAQQCWHRPGCPQDHPIRKEAIA